ncbi:hypothetical protein VPH35_086016 [Triticum aestivum]|uniref:Uncharacterized protein n=1 Tax=Triticum urartu TaxID=4572 RepID=A0A8R7UK42_TRIUA
MYVPSLMNAHHEAFRSSQAHQDSCAEFSEYASLAIFVWWLRELQMQACNTRCLENLSWSLHISSWVPGDTGLLSYFHVSEGPDLGIPALTPETGTAVKMFSVEHTCSSCCF